MAQVNVINEILTWSESKDRPMWQRDALRRLIEQGEIDENDIRELTDLCKSVHGLNSRMFSFPLSSDHIPKSGSETRSVSLVSLTHHTGVNALAHHQELQFGPELTVVYGDNATGKSGYTRILKRVCRARGAEEVLGNVMSGSAPGLPSAVIKFEVDGEQNRYHWDDRHAPDAFLSRISVFDRHCASVYLSKPTDVAFRPLGLDLFDKLADACQDVKKSLERERSELESQKLQFPSVTEGTAVHNLVTNLTSLTKPTLVTSLASISHGNNMRIRELRNRIRDLESENPLKIARTLEMFADRVTALINSMRDADRTLCDSAIRELFEAFGQMSDSMKELEGSRQTTFQNQPLKSTGSELWRKLWDSAEQFSTEEAYPETPFPFTGESSRCVLCQQLLEEDGKERLQMFREFSLDNIQSDFDRKAENYNTKFEKLNDSTNSGGFVKEVIDEIELDDPELAKAVENVFAVAGKRIKMTRGVLAGGSSYPNDLPEWKPNFDDLSRYAEGLKTRANELRGSNKAGNKSELSQELDELEARKVLADHRNKVIEEIERKQKIAAYQLCIEDTQTNAITRKSSDVTTRAVSQQLVSSFEDELAKVGFNHVEVELVPAGGARGVHRHKLRFKRAHGTEVDKVVSDGEARCLSIVSFFSELSTTSEQSAIIFDDPISSLDHMWRRKIVERLVKEAKSRQVIVFTHDITFLHILTKRGKERSVDVTHQCLRRQGTITGLSSKELPWIGLRVKERIKHLNRQLQSAEKSLREGETAQYEINASQIYGYLREAWERGVEEVLLNELIERYYPYIQTSRAKFLADICDEDISALNEGMSKCSRWLPGHDAPKAGNDPFPDPEELKSDIDMLDNWVKRIRKRRQKGSKPK